MFDEAIARLSEGAELSEKAGFLIGQIYPRLMLALTYTDLGAMQKARAVAEIAHSVASDKVGQFSDAAIAVLAEVCVRSGDLERGVALLQELSSDVAKSDLFLAAYVYAATAEIALYNGDYARTLELAEVAAERVSYVSGRIFTPELALYSAAALAGMGETDRALHELADGLRIAKEISNRRVLWQIAAMQAALLAQVGDMEAAEASRAEASEVVDFLLAHLSDPALRDSFLNLPAVRSLRERETNTRNEIA
ncbi:MAG: hypothetical protein HC802_12260 [Caldilineaceae bacterium]|nr:hypothetical protein [Caldilineaceae bacterium]